MFSVCAEEYKQYTYARDEKYIVNIDSFFFCNYRYTDKYRS